MEGLRLDIVTILERATVPSVPFTPKIKLNILFSLLFSVFVSAGVVVLKEYLDTTVRTPDDIEALKVPILSMIPHTAEGTGRSTAREAYNSLRTSLLFSRGDVAHYTLLVTSCVPKEGKTSVTTNLGKILSSASAGDRVLMVDCDFRRPMLHNKFNIDRRKGGVASYVMQSESADIETYIQNVAPNLDVLACGPIPPDPPKILGSQQFKDLLSRLKQRYRWVLLDSPPLLGLADAVVLSTICDGLCLVIRRNRVDKLAAQRCLGQMRDINVNVIGAVFNDLDFRSAYYTRYYRYGGGYYYYYYSSQEEKEKDSMMPIVERFRKRRRSRDDAVSETFFDS
jgi:capsular exopolysaccharide synthesis family protein